MKSLIRTIAVNTLAFFMLTQIVAGAQITNGAAGFVICGILFTIFSFFLGPVIRIIGFPVRMVSFGFFPILVNAAILFVLSLVVTQFSITAFFFPGVTLAGFVIPRIFFNTLFAFIATSLVFSISVKLINWVTD